MTMQLSLVIPFYQETSAELFPLFSTIATQKGLDFSRFEVILVHDGPREEPFSGTEFAVFPHLTIRLLEMSENRGPGVARQVGLDHALGKYVMFCDCDDLLQNVGILQAMLESMEEHGWDALSTPWLEEHIGESGTNFVTHEIECTWLHGKMFLREFLVQNNIRFHPELRVHEDSYFLSLLVNMTEKRGYLPLVSYIWTFNPNSITRRNDAIYSYDSFGIFVGAVLASVGELQERNILDGLDYKVTQLLCYTYFVLQSKEWQTPFAQQYSQEVEETLVLSMRDYWEIWDHQDEDFIAQIYGEEFAKSPRNFGAISFLDWVAHLRAKSCAKA